MKYILQNGETGFDLREYEKYLEREAGVMAQFVRGDDLLRVERFTFGPESLHDARLERFLLSSTVTNGSKGIDQVQVTLRGPYFDRYFELQYEQVLGCFVDAPAPQIDLLIHEIRLEGDILVHELHFDRSKRVEISCRALRFQERFG